MYTNNVNEIEKFTILANKWWDENGALRLLHTINPIRSKYILKVLQDHQLVPSDISLLDIGCGGGILSESMAKSGIKVTGIDASSANIEVAKAHAEKNKLKINYQTKLIENIQNVQYDVVIAMEIIEHVENIDFFIQKSISLLKPGGIIILSTLNRNLKSLLFAKFAAEYILKWLPIGTHNWHKFIKPSELTNILRYESVQVLEMLGINYNIISGKWKLNSDVSMNYIITGKLPIS